MKEFLKHILTPIDNHWVSWAICIAAWCLSIVLVFVVIFGLYYLINFAWAPVHTGTGIISELYYKPPYTTTTLMTVGKSLMPITHYHHETWNVCVNFNGSIHKTTTGEDLYRLLKEGQSVKFEYQTGRLDKSSISITSLFYP